LMMTTHKPLLTVLAADLMTCPVEVVPREMSLRAAAHMLSQAQISGAPVVDAEGRCVGVLSTTDFMHWAEKGGRTDKPPFTEAPCVCADWQVVDLGFIPQDEVRWHMTRDPVTVTPSTPIRDLARMMLDAHIHRVIVVDETRRPVGIVTSTDILAAVAHQDGD